MPGACCLAENAPEIGRSENLTVNCASVHGFITVTQSDLRRQSSRSLTVTWFWSTEENLLGVFVMESARYVPLDGPYHPACALITEADVLLPISKVREPSQLRDYNLSYFFVIPISILTSWDYPYTASFFARIPVIKSYEMLIWVLFGESSIWGFRRTLYSSANPIKITMCVLVPIAISPSLWQISPKLSGQGKKRNKMESAIDQSEDTFTSVLLREPSVDRQYR